MKILFIGNSKTYRQNFPLIFKKLVESSGKEIYIDKATKPGADLIELYNETETLEKIYSEKCYNVVIKERTFKALKVYLTEFKEGAIKLCNEILKNNNETQIIYNACGVYNDFNIEEYEKTNNHYEQIAKLTNGQVCYQGNAFINFHNHFSEIELYEDKQHPTLVGAYLSACCLYNTIFNERSSKVKYFDVLNPKIAMDIQNIADEVYLKN